MKLWDSLTTCLILLSAVYVAASLRSRRHAARRSGRAAESPLEQPPVQGRVPASASPGTGPREAGAGARTSVMEEPPLDDMDGVVDFIKGAISRLRRASSPTSPSLVLPSVTASSAAKKGRTRKRESGKKVDKGGRLTTSRGRTERKVRRGGRGGGRIGRRGCALKQIHLNVTDLGLGYHSSEEMIFRYCSGPCRKSETNYDRILQNLAHNGRFPPKDTPPRACCRPIAFDDDLSFLDDNLVYHTVRKHSARKCGCV